MSSGERESSLSTEPTLVGIDTASDRVHIYGHLPYTRQRIWTTQIKDANPDVRRIELFRFARYVFSKLPPGSWIFCEEPITVQNGKTTRLLGLAAGAIWAAHLDYSIFWYWANISTWKKAIVGSGNASKAQIQEHVQTVYDEEFDDEDSYDAYCIWRYGQSALELMAGPSETSA